MFLVWSIINDSFQLAQLMNGTLELASTPGIGSIATLTIPLCLSSVQNLVQRFPESPTAYSRRLSRSMIDIIDSQKMLIESSGHLDSRSLAAVTEVPADRNALPDLIAATSDLSIEERNKIHILVVEDK